MTYVEIVGENISNEISMTQCFTEPTKLGSIAHHIDNLVRFAGSPDQFLQNLLSTQCYVSSAASASILRLGLGDNIEVLAVYPPISSPDSPPEWLSHAAQSVRQVVAEYKTQVICLESSHPTSDEMLADYLVLIPVHDVTCDDSNRQGVAAFLIEGQNKTDVQSCCERLELTVGLLDIYVMRLALHKRNEDLEQVKTAANIVAAIGEHDRFITTTMRLCNEVASRWKSERVGLGFLTGRNVQLVAMCHTEKFDRKTQLVRDIEAAMEECLDQDTETFYPTTEDSAYVSRAIAELSKRHGPNMIACLPLRNGGEVVAVLMVECNPERPLKPEAIETLRLTCELCTPRLKDLHGNDRWIGAKCAIATRKLFAGIIGPQHTWMRLASILILCGTLFLTFAKTDYRPEAPFVLQSTRQQVIVAPFDGYLSTAPTEIGNLVEPGTTVLATLETAEIELELAAVRADKASYIKQKAVAQRDGDTAGAQMAQAQADKIEAQINLLEYRLKQATITSDIRGLVVTGDLERQLGAPVKVGDILFEVAQLESIRAELALPEGQVQDIIVGLEGELATASYPGRKIPFVVERINPVAEVVNERNVFKIRVRLQESHDWMRPGMEGVAKITIGRRSYGWILTRRFVNWIRMELWL